jgi:multiple sugar transport system substrate-binding protein
MTLRIALVGGPMYDHLYSVFDEYDVEVIVHDDHPTLNRKVAEMLEAGQRIDLVSTHSKYAPSQASWLQPLDSLMSKSSIEQLAPLAVDLCRYQTELLTIPRLIDVRITWLRSDRVETTPTTWDDLIAGPVQFGFPGKESGLFGTFYEMVVGAGGRIFDDEKRPCFNSDESVQAMEMLNALAQKTSADLPNWHYDQVDQALLNGTTDASGAWPGAWGSINSSDLAPVLRPHRYPSGAKRWVSYAGCHSWGIPTTCADLDGATALLHRLTSIEVHSLDASGGNMCANVEALAQVTPVNDIDQQRLAITRETINEAMITYPSHVRFPEVEDAGWMLINETLRGQRSPQDAVQTLQQVAMKVFTTDRS